MTQKLYGRLPKKNDPRNLKLGKYTANLPAPPTVVNWVSNAIKSWEMAGNDTLGDCVIAGKYHLIKSWMMDESKQLFTLPLKQITDLYFKLTGGRDVGLNLQDVLNHWKSEGLWGDKIQGYVSVDEKNLTEVKQAIYLFGGVDIGISVMSQFEQVQAGGVWSATSGRSLGGHCIELLGYDDTKQQFTLCSWGEIYYITYPCFSFVCDEVYAALSTDWCNKKSPAGFDLPTLQKDLSAIGQV